MRVLYAGSLGINSTSLHRREALVRLGHEVIDFDSASFETCGSYWQRALRLRLLIGPTIGDCNRQLLAAAHKTRPQIVWFDKALYIQPATLRRLREMGIKTVHYNIDNPFGPRKDPGWRLIRKSLPLYDLHLVQRDINLTDYRKAGARDVFMLRTAYEPTIHFPPPQDWSDQDRPHDVVFVGTPYDQRAAFLLRLWREFGIPVKVWGISWKNVLPNDALEALWQGPEVYNSDYRQTLWQSRICLSFVTHSNCDDVAHKSFEIAACGSFLLAEDTQGHRDHFESGKEAIFFRDVAECASQIRKYLPEAKYRETVGRAARKRCDDSGYSNDARLSRVFSYLEEIFKFE